MNLYTAKLLMPVRRRHDFPHGRLNWLPDGLYATVVNRIRGH